MHVLIRKIAKKDIPFTAQVQKESWLTTYVNDELGLTYDIIYQHVKDTDSPESIVKKEKYLDDPNSISLLAEIDGKIVGFLAGTNKEDINELNAIYLIKVFQNKGIGSKMIEKFFQSLKNKSLPCKVNVASYNQNAINFYKKKGFTNEEKAEARYITDTIFMPTIILTKYPD